MYFCYSFKFKEDSWDEFAQTSMNNTENLTCFITFGENQKPSQWNMTDNWTFKMWAFQEKIFDLKNVEDLVIY